MSHPIIVTPFIFAPTIAPEENTILVEDKPVAGNGYQSTLPIDEEKPILYDAKEMPIYEKPKTRPIGFGR